MLKLPEVAQRLGVSEKTARRYIKAGTIPSVFIGNAYRVREEDLEEYVRQAQVEPGGGDAPKAPSRPSPEAPKDASEEARLSFLDGWRESILAVVNKLGKEFDAAREGGSREDLLTLYSVVAFSRLGAAESLEAEEVMQEREGDSEEVHRARERAWRALLRFDDLAEDVEELVDADPEENSATIIRIADHRRRRVG